MREQPERVAVGRTVKIPDTDSILVPIPRCNDVLHAASIMGVQVRIPTSDVGPGIIITHGATDHVICKAVDLETLEEAEGFRLDIVRAWRYGLFAYAQMLALAASSGREAAP